MEEIAQVYARSLFEVAQERGTTERVREELGQFVDALQESRELQTFLFSPYFSTEEKKAGLDRAVTGEDETVRNFLQLLVENHRMPVVFRVRREVDRLWRGGEPAPARRDHERGRAGRGDRRRASATRSDARPAARSS